MNAQGISASSPLNCINSPQSEDVSPAGSPPRLTVVIVPRERFSCTQESLESLLENTSIPYNLVYVDGNSPPPICRYLRTQAQTHGFRLLRFDRFLSPNQARNIGLSQVKTPYVVFLDNDVIVSPGWLSSLVDCAEATGPPS